MLMVRNKAGHEVINDPSIQLTPQLALMLGIGENALQSVILYYGVGCEPLSARATRRPCVIALEEKFTNPARSSQVSEKP